MTKEEILKKLKFDLELRNRSEDTIQDYSKHDVRIDTTTWYLQLSDSETLKLTSPIDTMEEDI